MLHDARLSHAAGPGQDDRRTFTRAEPPPPVSELIVLWHHEPEMPVRYRMLDSSAGGVRLRSSLPMLTGMTGHAVRMLPCGTTLEKPMMVVWVREARDGHGYELGLRFIESG